jgi:hypothetical protein
MASALPACVRASFAFAIDSRPFSEWQPAAKGQASCDGRVMDSRSPTLPSARPEAVNVASNVTHSTGANDSIVHGIEALPPTSYLVAASKSAFEQTMQCRTAIVNKGRINRSQSDVLAFSLWAGLRFTKKA